MIAHVSQERMRDELCMILVSDRPARGIRLMAESGLLNRFLPELQACVGFEQRSSRHDKQVFEHIMEAVALTPPRLRVRLAALLHDIGKPVSFSVGEDGEGHFYGHHSAGEKMAREILGRLLFDTRTIDAVSVLVGEHMSRYDFLRTGTVEQFIARVGVENLEDLFDLQIADIKASCPPHDFSEVLSLKEEIRQVLRRRNS